MKKIFTLILGLMLTVAMFAADRKPTVTVTSPRKYQIVIDGERYFTNGNTINISNLFYGPHDVKVYKMRPGSFMSSRKRVASSSFQLRNSDVQINIDRFGQLQISESNFGRDWNDHDWNDHNYGRGNNRDNDRGGDHDYRHRKGNRDRNF
jgi:hypothetical protein